MVVLQDSNDVVKSMLSNKSFDGMYCHSKFNVFKTLNGTHLLYNTFTRQVIALEENEVKEYASFVQSKCFNNTKFTEYLIKSGFLVNSATDENKRYKEILSFLRNIYSIGKKKSFYKIFTTINCNARCFYCFEEGIKHSNMSVDTAKDVVQYILDTHFNGEIALYWFGGEPLLNIKVINYICEQLSKHGVVFRSKMITNGLLFDDDTISLAKNSWNLKNVQITLDGMEQEHNTRKAYVNAKGSPFNDTISNIHKLLDAGIPVSLRLNFDENNLGDIEQLTDYLFDEFAGSKKLTVYPAILSDQWFNHEDKRPEHVNAMLQEKYNELCTKLYNSGLYKAGRIKNDIKLYYCIAANPTCSTISVDGKLYTCQSCDDDMIYGNVVEHVTNTALYDDWTRSSDNFNKCDDCPYLPECSPFDKCVAANDYCRLKKDLNCSMKLKNLLNNTVEDIEKDNYD